MARDHPLLHRLAEGLNILYANVERLEASTLWLEDGRRVSGRVLVYAGGASGAHLLGLGGRFTPARCC